MTEQIPKPNDALIKLVDMGWLHGLYIEQRQTGTDTADTFVKITGSDGKVEGLWNTYSKYLVLIPNHNSVCRVHESYIKQVIAWRAFEKQNETELTEYKRLKAKFENLKLTNSQEQT